MVWVSLRTAALTLTGPSPSSSWLAWSLVAGLLDEVLPASSGDPQSWCCNRLHLVSWPATLPAGYLMTGGVLMLLMIYFIELTLEYSVEKLSTFSCPYCLSNWLLTPSLLLACWHFWHLMHSIPSFGVHVFALICTQQRNITGLLWGCDCFHCFLKEINFAERMKRLCLLSMLPVDQF